LRLKLRMTSKLVLGKAFKKAPVLLMLLLLVLSFNLPVTSASAQASGLYDYEFIVDKEGFTIVNITFSSESAEGSSWVFVPKYFEWTNCTLKGRVTDWYLGETENVTDGSYYFYQALYFSFRSDGAEFVMNVQFNLSTSAMIIEPDGIFYSPQIGFEDGNRFEARVILPLSFTINEAMAFSNTSSYQPKSTSPGLIVFDNIPETENLMRIEVGFKIQNSTAQLLQLRNGIFTFETVPRYTEYALSILDLYNKTYNELVDLFNVTLESATVRFFLPDFESLFTIGGYVPFTPEGIGDIHINIVFTRYVEGYIEVIALHELVHHFLWKAGVSPEALLWFHEGMAQYISMEIADEIGYEGVQTMKQEIQLSVSSLIGSIGNDIGFLKSWSPASQPSNIGVYYVAAYHITSSLAENYSGLPYYSQFFKLMKGKTIDSNVMLGYYLSLAAQKSVVGKLNDWGFDLPDLYLYAPVLSEVETVLNDVNSYYQPYKFLAGLLYEQAIDNAKQETVTEMHLYLAAALMIARLAPLLTLITVSGLLFAALMWILKTKGVFSPH
jgi:hypothetical protein